MNILITGGAGFIGFHLSNHLSRQGHDVLCIDSVNEYYSQELKNIRIDNFESNLRFLKVDISDETQIASIFKNLHFDVVIHLAAQPGIRLGIDGMEKYTFNNLVSFSNICKHVENSKTKLFIFASSSSV
jgi:UDP-glucuronate 4-epimerase